jgi:hypothetical protein
MMALKVDLAWFWMGDGVVLGGIGGVAVGEGLTETGEGANVGLAMGKELLAELGGEMGSGDGEAFDG